MLLALGLGTQVNIECVPVWMKIEFNII
jgi:hypothetical protein